MENLYRVAENSSVEMSTFDIKETKNISINGGYLIDGFPSVGFTSAIAAESLIRTTRFELAGYFESDMFPPISIIKDGIPNLPAAIYANNDLNTAVFSSYHRLGEAGQRIMARTMLKWAEKHGVSYIVSSVAVKSDGPDKVMAAVSTDDARDKMSKSGIEILSHGAIPGIPGELLNKGMLNNQNVIVVLFSSTGTGPDFKSSIELCNSLTKIIPGVSCDINALQKEAEKVEKAISEAADAENRPSGMYR